MRHFTRVPARPTGCRWRKEQGARGNPFRSAFFGPSGFDSYSRARPIDGRVLSGTREVGHGNRGIYVDDRRYGRVLISWDGSSASTSRPLTGNVTTLAGRLVYDLDESETTERLDAP